MCIRDRARQANSTPNGGPHLELTRLRLKTWSKIDFLLRRYLSHRRPYCYYYKHPRINAVRDHPCSLRIRRKTGTTKVLHSTVPTYASTISRDRDRSKCMTVGVCCASYWQHATHACLRTVVRAVDLCWLLSRPLNHARNQVFTY